LSAYLQQPGLKLVYRTYLSGVCDMRLSSLSFVCFPILLSALPAQCMVSVVQSNSGNATTGGTIVSVGFTSNPTTGNLIAVACLSAANWGTISVSDSVNFYTSVATYNVNSSLGGVEWFYAKSISRGANSVACKFSASSGSRSIFIYEISGASGVMPFDIHQESSGSSTTPDTNPVNSSSANEIVLGVAICASTCSAGSGFTGLSDGHGNAAEFKIVTLTGAQHTPFSQASANWADSIVTFRAESSIAETNVSNTIAAPRNIHLDTLSEGPNPWVDITHYGARSIAPNSAPAIPGVTASIRAPNSTATISSASSFQNRDGVIIYGAGAAHSMTTPRAPTVTPSLAASGTGTGIVTNGPPGQITYNYQIIARNKQGGMTAASTVGTTAKGAASLGLQSVKIASLSKSGLQNLVVTSSAHGLAVGAMVLVQGTTNDTDFGGWMRVATVPDTKHFTFYNGRDSANGATTSAIGGTASWWNCNHLSWTQVTGAFLYYVYGRTGDNLTLLGVSRPNGNIIDLTWDDFGSPAMDNFTAPYYVQNTPPSTATSNHLVTTIVSGAGTTTLTLANAASTTVTGAAILFDNAPAIAAAAAMVGQQVYTPVGTWVVNSYLSIPTLTTLSMSGTWVLNDSVVLSSGVKWYGDRVTPSGYGPPQFAFSGYPGINTQRAIPGLYLSAPFSEILSGLGFSSGMSNNTLFVATDQAVNLTMENIDFQTSGTADYMSVHLLLRGKNNDASFFNNFRNISMASGPSGGSLVSQTPLFACSFCGFTQIFNLSLSRRALHFGSAIDLYIHGGRYQGGNTPFLTVGGLTSIGGTASSLTVREIELDTTGASLVSNLTTATQAFGENSSFTIDNSGLPSSAFPNVSGAPIGNLLMLQSSGIGQNINATYINGRGVATLGANTSILASGSSVIGASMLTPAAPTIVLGRSGSCATHCVAAGTYNYAITANDRYGNGTALSPLSASGTTDGTQTITVSWVPVPGQVLTRRFRGTPGNMNSIDGPGGGIGSNSYIDSNANFYSNTILPPNATASSIGSQGVSASTLSISPTVFAHLGTPTNGNFVYCSDCTISNPCASGGTGALAKRLNGIWVCN
jgi:hypothetical protein